MAAGLLASGDQVDVAQQIWNAMHGAVGLELAGVTFSADPERTFASMLDAMLAGTGATLGSLASCAGPARARRMPA